MIFLTQVSEQHFQISFKLHLSSLPTSKWNDAVLGGLLVGMQKEGQIESVIMSQCPSCFHSELPHLLAAFAEVLENKEKICVYSKATCYEFHQLLVVTLIIYEKALSVFSEVERKLNLEETGKSKGEMERDQNMKPEKNEHKPTSVKFDDTPNLFLLIPKKELLTLKA